MALVILAHALHAGLLDMAMKSGHITTGWTRNNIHHPSTNIFYRFRWFFWGPWFGAIAGGIFGALVYDVLLYTGLDSPLNRP